MKCDHSKKPGMELAMGVYRISQKIARDVLIDIYVKIIIKKA